MSVCRNNTYLHAGIFLLTLIVSDVAAQEESQRSCKRRSYSYYGELKIEDNSFLVDEAFNQEKGIMQFISNLYWSNASSDGMAYAFTHEIPIVNDHHQVSYTLQYNFNQRFDKAHYSGPGDMSIGYTYLVAGKEDWLMMAPQINFILPTGDPAKGLGSGGLGGKLGVALTKRLSRGIVTHYNISCTMVYRADHYVENLQAEARKAEKNINVQTFSTSVIWYPASRFNLIFESVVDYYLEDTKANGSNMRSWQVTNNPGLRFAVDLPKAQLVAGASFPLSVHDNFKNQPCVFIYLSLEEK